MLARRHLPAPVDQPAFLPARAAHLGEVRSAQSRQLTRGLRKLDGAKAVGQWSWPQLLRSDSRPGTTLVERGWQSPSLRRSTDQAQRPGLGGSAAETSRATLALPRPA